MSQAQRELVRNITLKALTTRFGDSADRFEDDPYRIGVSFPNGGFIDIAIADVPRAPDPDDARCPHCGMPLDYLPPGETYPPCAHMEPSDV